MGAENSVLEGCQWGEEVAASNLDWNLQHAETKDGRLVTVFEPKKAERKYNEMLQKLAQSLKTLRHPSILRFTGAGRSSDGFRLVTEFVVPLISVMDKLSAYEICAGLHDVMDAVIFLHDKVGISHNNICIGAVFVAHDGGWRLGELQHSCPFESATSEFLDACRAYRDQGALAPEEKQGEVEVKKGLGHLRDVYSLGVLIEQLIDSLRELGEFSQAFEKRVSACLAADPSLRPTVLTLKNDSLFQNDFVQILGFLKNVALKTAEEKAEFFSGLLPRLLALPEDVVGSRLAVPLLSRFVLLDDTAVKHVVPHLLTPKPTTQSPNRLAPSTVTPVLSEVVFRTHVIPELEKILLVHDAHIRLVLLNHFSCFAYLFDTDALREEIFPQVLLGLRDTSDAIVAASLRALADLVPLLGGDTVIGGQRKTFFFHGLPKFPTNGPGREREKEKSLSSVADVMQPLKSSLNGKPLLKDLAGHSRKAKVDPELEKKKLAERERRREEARLRREERQQKLKQQTVKKDSKADSHHTPSSETADNQTFADSDAITSTDEKTENIPSSGKPDSHDFDTERNSADEIKQPQNEEADSFSREASQDDWSDWEDTEADSALKSQEDVIGEEIEAELAQMSDQARPFGVTSKVQTSPDPYRVGSPKISLWEKMEDTVITDSSALSSSARDLELKAQDHGHLKKEMIIDDLSSQKKEALLDDFSSQKAEVILDDWQSQKISTDDWDTSQSFSTTDWKSSQKHTDESTGAEKPAKSTPGKGLKLVAKKKATPAMTAKNAKAQKSSSAGDLGLGYDIKSIELTAVKQEVDFFADMMPEIKPQVSKSALEFVGVGSERDDKGSKASASPARPSSNLFAVTTDTGEDASGWGEDADWGTDDF